VVIAILLCASCNPLDFYERFRFDFYYRYTINVDLDQVRLSRVRIAKQRERGGARGARMEGETDLAI
jgi:hypothetical protein